MDDLLKRTQNTKQYHHPNQHVPLGVVIYPSLELFSTLAQTTRMSSEFGSRYTFVYHRPQHRNWFPVMKANVENMKLLYLS